MISGGVQISKTRGLTVDGEQHGAIRRDDLRFEPGALGAGACSVVRLARHTATNERYAVKLFAIFDDAKRRQLVEEIRTLFSLDCAALVQFHGAYLDGATGKVGVVLDFMDAGSVEGLINQRRAPLPEKVALVDQQAWLQTGYSAAPLTTLTPSRARQLLPWPQHWAPLQQPPL